jgi:hypothetical protein
MAKKEKKAWDILIKCDSQEVNAIMNRFFRTYIPEMVQHLKQGLGQMGIQSDPTFKFTTDGSIKASMKNFDKGPVITTPGGTTINITAYKELEKGTIYALPERESFAVLVKTGEGVDTPLGHFRTWVDLVENLATVKVPDAQPVQEAGTDTPGAEMVVSK